MQIPYESVLLRIFLGEADRSGHQPFMEKVKVLQYGEKPETEG